MKLMYFGIFQTSNKRVHLEMYCAHAATTLEYELKHKFSLRYLNWNRKRFTHGGLGPGGHW